MNVAAFAPPAPARNLLRIRDVGFPLAAFALAAALPYQWILYAFIAIGQAHFLITYVYQYKGGRMGWAYRVIAAVLFIAGIAYFALSGALLPIIFVTASIFSIHLALDEFTLHGERVGKWGAVTVACFGLVFTVAQIVALFKQHAWLLVPLMGVLCAVALTRFLSRVPLAAGERYLVLVGALMVLGAAVLPVPNAIIGTVIILHYLNWYVGYGLRLEGKPVPARAYWIHVAWTVGLSCLLFAAYTFGYAGFALFFEPAHFYAWTIAHVVLSFAAVLAPRT